MTRSQVRFALGTPLVATHSIRTLGLRLCPHKNGRLVEQRRIVAIFKDDTLLRIERRRADEARLAEMSARMMTSR